LFGGGAVVHHRVFISPPSLQRAPELELKARRSWKFFQGVRTSLDGARRIDVFEQNTVCERDYPSPGS